MLTSISSATRKARSTACCLSVWVHTTIPCWYWADRQNSAHHWGIWKKIIDKRLKSLYSKIWFRTSVLPQILNKRMFSTTSAVFSHSQESFSDYPNSFCLSTQQNKLWQEISYAIIAHNAKLLWQHVSAPADQGLAAGGPLTPLLEPLCRLMVRQAGVYTASQWHNIICWAGQLLFTQAWQHWVTNGSPKYIKSQCRLCSGKRPIIMKLHIHPVHKSRFISWM